MKSLFILSCALFFAGFIISGCSKESSYSGTPDYTSGMTANVLTWTGNMNGYAKGDTVFTDTVAWPKYFNRNVTDTSIAVQRVDNDDVSVFGYLLRFRSIDSVNKVTRFDTTFSGCLPTILNYYYTRDSMTFEFHQTYGYNSGAGQSYQTNALFHTNKVIP